MPYPFRIIGQLGVTHFHAKVSPQYYKVKVKPETETCSDSNIFIKLIQLKLCPWPVFIFIKSPDITGIEEHCTLENPEQLKPVLSIEFKFNIGRYIKKARISRCR